MMRARSLLGPSLLLASCGVDKGSEAFTTDSASTDGWTEVALEAAFETSHPYEDDARLSRTFFAGDAEQVQVYFERLELEEGYDFVRIYDGDGVLQQEITGAFSGWSETIYGTEARVELTTDYSVTAWGVRIPRWRHKAEIADAGAWARFSLDGTFATPHPYPNDADIEWVIDGPADATQIRVVFEGFETERGYDGVFVMDADGEIVATYTGARGDFTSAAVPGRQARLRFISDYSVTAEGFSMPAYEAFVPSAPPPTAGAEGTDCETTPECDAGLYCQGRDEDGIGVCRDTGRVPGEGDSCRTMSDCGANLTCAGIQLGGEGFCVPAWMYGVVSEAPDAAIPDNDPAGIERRLSVRGLGTVSTDVVLSVDIAHTYRGDLQVTLTNPTGTEVVVTDKAGGSRDDFVFDAPLAGFPGDEDVNGTWTLRVRDLAGQDVGRLNSWGLELYSRWD